MPLLFSFDFPGSILTSDSCLLTSLVPPLRHFGVPLSIMSLFFSFDFPVSILTSDSCLLTSLLPPLRYFRDPLSRTLSFIRYKIFKQHSGHLGHTLCRMIFLGCPPWQPFPIPVMTEQNPFGHHSHSFWTSFCILFSQTLELPHFSNLLIGPATAGLEFYFTIYVHLRIHSVFWTSWTVLNHRDTEKSFWTSWTYLVQNGFLGLSSVATVSDPGYDRV